MTVGAMCHPFAPALTQARRVRQLVDHTCRQQKALRRERVAVAQSNPKAIVIGCDEADAIG
ncbi:hypothetical protein HC891_24060 [Candidatus Gracilibacteria bacterium]|nr:hypothetical protein [Candidatus Gracilibacteria bacterium]